MNATNLTLVAANVSWLSTILVSVAKCYELVEALSDTQIVKYVARSTDGNWRNTDNYRAVRDFLGMFYMH